jgi:outer membrane receptor protein involved in Fe transport
MKNRTKFRNCSSWLILAIATTTPFCAAVEASAQSQAAAPGASGAAPSQAEPQGLQEIVVTATKREEKLSKVPASITALSQAKMDVQGIKNVQDVVAVTPGLTFSNTGFNSSGNETIYIRGIVSKAGTPTTGVYIDETPIQAFGDVENYLGSSFPKVFDLERVEVLRGPQGTLFGGGAEGGVVRFITPQPSLTDYSAYVRTELSGTQGGDVSYEGGVALGGPIVDDKLGFRISGWERHDGGYTDRHEYTTGRFFSNSDWSDSTVVHAALRFAPTDQLTITPSLFYQKVHTNDQSIYWPQLSNPSNDQYIHGNAVASPSTDFFYLSSLNISYDFSDVKFTSVTSNFYRSGSIDYDGTNVAAYVFSGNPYPTLPGVAYYDSSLAYTRQRVWTEEARLQSTDPESPLQWVAGVYYQRIHEGQGETPQDPYLDRFLGFDLGLVTPDYGGPADSAGPVREGYILDQVAEFGNVDYKIVDDVTLTAGLRVVESVLNFAYFSTGPFSAGTERNKGSTTETPVTPKFGVSWQQSPDTMLYFTVAKGYRVGGVNVPVPLTYCGAALAAQGLSGTPPTYNSDHTWSYEVGAKGKLADGLIRYDASAYHIDWSNVQTLNQLPCGFNFTENSGDAESNGFDLTIDARVYDSLTLGLALGYDDAYYSSTVKSGGGILVQSGTAIGNPVSSDLISPWTVSFTAQYDLPFYREYAPYIWAEYDFHSRNPGPFNSLNPAATSYDPTIPADPATNLVKLRIGFEVSDVKVSLFVDNLLDSHPQLALQHPLFGSPVYSAQTFRPRTIGINAIYRY